MDLPYGFKCTQDDCLYYAIYSGDERPLYCDVHHPSPHAKIKRMFTGYKHRICIEPFCRKRASFNYEIGMKQIFCQDHKQDNMVNVASTKCRECNQKTAKYGYKKDYPKPIFCRECRDKQQDKEDIVDCYETLCSSPDCWTQATFGYNRKDKHEWRCKEHKRDNMTAIKNIFRLCQFAGGCNHQANYNFPNEKRAVFCRKHKDLGMVDMYHKTCEVENCRLRPSYNLENEKEARFCLVHKHDNMVDVISKKCSEKGCNKFPFYNFPQFSYPIVCPDHVVNGMVDVRHIICEVNDCNTQASYGFLGTVVSRCATHKLNGMLRQSNRRCQYLNCNEYAFFGFENGIPLFCELHKQSNHINLVEQECNKCHLFYLLNLQGMCIICESSEKKIIMKKQYLIKEWLLCNDYKFIIHDKPIDNGVCVRNRPDFVFESSNGGHMIVLEVDENMHKGDSYTPECEIVRMVNISQALGQPTIFIRFNPDNYRKENLLIKNDDPKYRHLILKKWLDYCMKMSIGSLYNIGFCSVIKLFYNEFEENNVQFETLLHFDNDE